MAEPDRRDGDSGPRVPVGSGTLAGAAARPARRVADAVSRHTGHRSADLYLLADDGGHTTAFWRVRGDVLCGVPMCSRGTLGTVAAGRVSGGNGTGVCRRAGTTVWRPRRDPPVRNGVCGFVADDGGAAGEVDEQARVRDAAVSERFGGLPRCGVRAGAGLALVEGGRTGAEDHHGRRGRQCDGGMSGVVGIARRFRGAGGWCTGVVDVTEMFRPPVVVERGGIGGGVGRVAERRSGAFWAE